MTSSSVAPSPARGGGASDLRADVIVVGAGPGGSATAAYLADHGLDVVLLEKSAFPRDNASAEVTTPAAPLAPCGWPIIDLTDEPASREA